MDRPSVILVLVGPGATAFTSTPEGIFEVTISSSAHHPCWLHNVVGRLNRPFFRQLNQLKPSAQLFFHNWSNALATLIGPARLTLKICSTSRSQVSLSVSIQSL